MSQHQLYKVGVSGHTDNKINVPEFNRKYIEWLRRRGLTDPGYAAEAERAENGGPYRRILPRKKGIK